MNKLLIVLLAVCLVSVQAFVKRDAPKPADNEFTMETMKKNLDEFGKNVNAELQKAFDPEKMKKNFNDFVDNVNKAFEGAKPK